MLVPLQPLSSTFQLSDTQKRRIYIFTRQSIKYVGSRATFRTFHSFLILAILWNCSWPECSVYANIHRWRVVPAHLWEDMDKPRGASGRVRVERVFHLAIRVPTVLDHQELVG